MHRYPILLLASLTVAAPLMAGPTARPGAARPFTLPRQAAVLPPEATFVMGIDVQRLVASPLYQRMTGGPLGGYRQTWDEIEKRTGLNPARDLTAMIAAGQGGADDAGLAVSLGRFTRAKVESALLATPGLISRTHNGRKVVVLEARAGQKPTSVSVLEDGLIVAGSPSAVDAAIDRHVTRAPGLTSNTAVVALVGKVEAGSAFWMCGDPSLLSAAGGPALTGAWAIPSVKSLVVSGQLDPDLSGSIVAETPDAGSATNVANMARGLVALVSMQAAQRPEIGELTSGIAIGSAGALVRISARVAYDLLDKLQATPAPTPSAAPRERAKP